MPQRSDDHLQLIRQCLRRYYAYPSSLQRLANRRAGVVNLLSPPAPVTDRQHYRANIRSKTLFHCYSLRFSPGVQKLWPKALYHQEAQK